MHRSLTLLAVAMALIGSCSHDGDAFSGEQNTFTTRQLIAHAAAMG